VHWLSQPLVVCEKIARGGGRFFFFLCLHFRSGLTAYYSCSAVYSNSSSHRRASLYPPLLAVLCLRFLMREKFNTPFPLCTHELALSTRLGVGAGEKLNLQEKLAYAGFGPLT
ncbi:unnamed protein product, partial [Ectocarpus sp. 4 AP-2014]